MTNPVSAAQALDLVILNWEAEAKKLPEKQRKICINNMKPLISEIRDGFNTLRSQGASQGTLEMMAINNLAILKITAQEYCPIEESSKELAKLGKKISDLASPDLFCWKRENQSLDCFNADDPRSQIYVNALCQKGMKEQSPGLLSKAAAWWKKQTAEPSQTPPSNEKPSRDPTDHSPFPEELKILDSGPF